MIICKQLDNSELWQRKFIPNKLGAYLALFVGKVQWKADFDDML